MNKDNQAYFLQRAAEEMTAAERATAAAAARAHRELSLRYSLKLILPEPCGAGDDSRPIGLPKPALQAQAPVAPSHRPAKRRQG